MKVLFLILFTILFTTTVLASCNSSQVDINTASLEELDEIYGVGSVKAQEIISSRPFENLEELLRVNGIGAVTLEKIKKQGLACIENSTNKSEEENKEEITKEIKEKPLQKEKEISVKKEEKISVEEKDNSKEIELFPSQTIQLNPKTIKTLDSKEESGKKNYTKYSIVFFCILLLFLYKIKPKQKKNEWK